MLWPLSAAESLAFEDVTALLWAICGPKPGKLHTVVSAL